MGWDCYLETDWGEIFRIILPNGLTGGKAILSFISIAAQGCSIKGQNDRDLQSWINEFNEKSGSDFCVIISKIDTVLYAGTTTLGNWEFNEDEFEFFLHRNPGFPIAEAEFKQTIRKIHESWMSVQELIADVNLLIGEFNKCYLPKTEWYVEEDTIPDFLSLLTTLKLAQSRGARKVRLRID